MRHYFHNSLRALFLFLAVLLSLPMLAQKLNLKEARLIDNVRELSQKEGQGNITVPAPARHVVNYLAMKTPSRTENINPYEAMAGEWTMTTASGKKWNVTVHAAAEDDPDYNNVLYVTGMMGYDWTVLTMPYSYNYEEGKPEVYIKAGELFAEGVNFTGLGVCNVYLYNIDGSSLALNDMVAEVSADGKTLDFGANSFYGAVFTSSNQYAGGWFNENGVKMTQKSGIKLNGIYYSLNAETKQAAVIANSSGWYSGDVVIPESVEFKGISHSVTSIGEGAFSGCSGLTSVTIPNSVTSIGYQAFSGCSGLTSVTIPNSVTSIEYGTFAGCSGLTSVTIGNSVKSIGDEAFLECSGLTSVTIPNSVTSIGVMAFRGCSGLTSVTIGNSVTSIGDYAFLGCSGLTSVTIPNSVTSIGFQAFSGCSGLTSVTIGNSVESIGYGAFANCLELLDVYCYAENVPSTPNDAFAGSYPEYATLHVPDASVDSYKATAPWSSFGKIVGLSGEEPEQPEVPEMEKCATPVVTYVDGCLEISCETEGAEFITDIADNDIKKHYESKIELSATYNIEVYATKANCENSDTVSVALVWVENGEVNEETGVISVPAAPVLVQGNGGILTVSGVVQNTEVVVYTIDGVEVDRAVASDGTATIYTGLQSGTIVVVKFGNKSVKVRI